MQGNGPYNGRFYYNWNKRKNTITKPPMMKAFLKRGELILQWNKQKTAKDYEIWWNTSRQECGEFVKLATTRKSRHTISREYVEGKMLFKIRARNNCGVSGSFSRILILTIKKPGLA